MLRPLVVVHDFDLIGAIGVPDKADTPLVIDADAVLSFAMSSCVGGMPFYPVVKG